MKLTEASLRNPAAVAVAVLMVCAFGLMSLFDLPLQLFPDIERPQMSIQTNWRAASPQERNRISSRSGVCRACPAWMRSIERKRRQHPDNLTFAVARHGRDAVEVRSA